MMRADCGALGDGPCVACREAMPCRDLLAPWTGEARAGPPERLSDTLRSCRTSRCWPVGSFPRHPPAR